MNLKMYPTRLLFTLSLLCCLSANLLAQTTTEDCNNGLDDDGDGLIDCYDQDCTCTGQCDDFYYTTCNADCFFIPPCGQVSLGIQWTGTAETGTYSTLVAGDMDADGIPDIVTYRVENPNIYIIDGATGATKVSIICPSDIAGGTAPAIADLDNDGFGELVIVANDLRLRCYEHDGTLKYTSPTPVGWAFRFRYAVPNIADFDHDGWAEINIGNQVFNGQTGALLASGGPSRSAGEHPARVAIQYSFCSPVAMDVLPDNFCPDCAGLEIVAGNQVLSVNLQTGAVNPIVTAPPGYSDGYTSVADFDRDGDLDAIVQGQRNGFNTVYCWDIQTSTVLRQYQLLNNWSEGASRVNIADLDGDGALDISFVSYPRLYALRNNFSLMWTNVTNDLSSITCSSVFDFCGDGSADVVYRGESKLQILNGATGQITWEDNCISATHIENPLVLDVDADGQTEIVIECSTNGTTWNGTVVAYEAVGTPGIASRQVWNQHAYFNTNINDDLSVPRIQQNPHIVGDSLRVNSFLNQFFNPTFPAGDAVLGLQSVVCMGDSLEISLTFCNTGDNALPANMPISAYRGNPQGSAAQWIGSVPVGFALAPDSCRTRSLKLPRIANDSIFLVLNDDHTIPTPFNLEQDFPSTGIGECDFRNNVQAFRFDYNPATLNLGPDTLICANTNLTLDAAGSDLVAWQWQSGGATGSTFVAAPTATYAVTATDICGITQTDQIAVGVDSSTIVDIGPDREVCQGEVFGLSESGFDFYNWSPGLVVDCGTCPEVTVSPIGTGMVILRAGFANGCVNRDTMQVIVHDTFNYKIDTTVCFGRVVEWNNVIIPPNSSHTFFLQSIHGCDSTVQVRVYGTTVGTFNVQVDTAVCLGASLPFLNLNLEPGDEETFLLSAVTGCDSTVRVKVMPKDTFSTAEARTICSGDNSDIFGQPISVSGNYRMTFSAQNGCDSTHTVQLTVLDPIVLQVDGTPTCLNEENGTLRLTVSGSAPPFSYAWDWPGAASNPSLQNLPAGSYAVTVTDSRDCTVSALASVDAFPPIVFSTELDSVRCHGERNGAINLSTADTSLLFSIDGLAYVQGRRFDNLPAGNYELTAEDIYGCVETLGIELPQPPQLLIQLPQDTAITLGDSLQINLQTNGFDPQRWVWNDSSTLSCAQCPNPVARPFGSFRYRLLVADAKGCTASDDFLLTVRRIVEAFVPNILDLNAEMDANRRLSLSFGPAVQRVLRWQIYDRWGNLVHNAQNLLPNDASGDWPGTHEGRPALPGVYAWLLELQLADGSVERLRGDVTLLR
jgi:hypothetical protein